MLLFFFTKGIISSSFSFGQLCLDPLKTNILLSLSPGTMVLTLINELKSFSESLEELGGKWEGVFSGVVWCLPSSLIWLYESLHSLDFHPFAQPTKSDKNGFMSLSSFKHFALYTACSRFAEEVRGGIRYNVVRARQHMWRTSVLLTLEIRTASCSCGVQPPLPLWANRPCN